MTTLNPEKLSGVKRVVWKCSSAGLFRVLALDSLWRRAAALPDLFGDAVTNTPSTLEKRQKLRGSCGSAARRACSAYWHWTVYGGVQRRCPTYLGMQLLTPPQPQNNARC